MRVRVDPLFFQSWTGFFELTGISPNPLQQNRSQGNFNCHLLITHTYASDATDASFVAS